jgi:hypothetical protein
MVSRLWNASRELYQQLAAAAPDERRRAAQAAVLVAAAESGLDGEGQAVADALAIVRNGTTEPVDDSVSRAFEAFIQELDSRESSLAARRQQDPEARPQFLVLFRQARAAYAARHLLAGGEEHEADAIYESMHAVSNETDIKNLVVNNLSSTPPT